MANYIMSWRWQSLQWYSQLSMDTHHNRVVQLLMTNDANQQKENVVSVWVGHYLQIGNIENHFVVFQTPPLSCVR